MLEGTREDENGKVVLVRMTWVSKQLGVTKKMLWEWVKQENAIVASRRGSRQVEKVKKGTVESSGERVI